MPDWITPTGHIDWGIWGASEPYSEEKGYDDNLGTFTQERVEAHTWGGFLELTVDSPISCSKIRFYPGDHWRIQTVDVDAYWGGAWHHIYQGTFTQSAWNEKELGDTYNVSSMRLRFENNQNDYGWARIHEADFYGEALPDILEGSIAAVSGVSGSLNITAGLQGSLVGQSASSAKVISIEALAGLIEAQSVISGDIKTIEELAGLIEGQSSVVGNVTIEDMFSLGGLIAAQSTVAGGLITIEELAGLIEAQSSVVGNVTIYVVYFVEDYIFVTPIFPIQPGWDAGADQGSVDIWNNVVPRVRDVLGSGVLKKNPSPTGMDMNLHTGAGLIRSHEIPWFEIAHLLPRLVQDVGNLVTQQTITCELYNADRTNAITVASITDNLGDGFAVEDVPSAPFDIASQDSLSFTIRVLQSGDLTIDGDYTLTLSTGETYTVTIIGSRIVLLPIRPEAPLREHIIWETKIMRGISANEQRIANRDMPRAMFEFRLKGGRKRVETILFDQQSKLLAVPAWHEPSYLTSAGSIGEFTINVDTTLYGNFYVGGYAVVFTDEYIFDVLEVESLTSTTLTFQSPLAADHVKNTQVMPLMFAYAEATTPMVKATYNDQDIQVKLHVAATPNDIADGSAFNTYNSKVFLDDANYLPNQQLQEAFRTKIYVLDNRSGDRSQFAQQLRALRHSQKGFKTNTRQELWELRQLLHLLKGRQVSFYIPTFSKDLVPNQTLVQSNSSFTMDNIGYVLQVNDRWSRQVFRMHLKDGTILTRTIVGSAELSKTEEQLTVDTVWPYDILTTDIERVEFLEKVRFDSDDIMIIHRNALGEAQCVVPTVEVIDDDV